MYLVAQGRNETEKIYSTPNSEWPVVAEFGSGDVIEMDVLVVYFHWVSQP